LQIYLIDGTYELFRHYYALPSARDQDGREVAAVRGVVRSLLGMINQGATHIAVATDHVIESFRNQLWPGYKTSAGVEPDLLAQFPLLEEMLEAAGFVVWPMVEFEADDALAAAAVAASQDPKVEQVVLCTPDKDLAQCVCGSRVVQLNRRTRTILDEAAVVNKFGVSPASIPDYLALVGDAADGYPGIAGIGKISAVQLLNRYGAIEKFPKAVLGERGVQALLFKKLATLKNDAPLFRDVEQLRWCGPTNAFANWTERMEKPRMLERALKAQKALTEKRQLRPGPDAVFLEGR